MFTSMRRVFGTSAIFLWRYGHRGRNNANVGLNYQLKEFQKDLDVFNSDPEGFEDLESTLLEVNKSHREYEQEVQKQCDKIRHFIVKRKYFRNYSMPNFLTYAEKERIRMLCNINNSEEWTCERLAESYPALANTIQKIANSNWMLLTNNRIIKHDAQVLKNWKLLKNGEFKDLLSNEFINHLTKFIDRAEINRTDQFAAEIYFKSTQINNPIATEFQSILGDKRRSQQILESTAIENQSNNPKNLAENLLKDRIEDENRRLDKNAMRKQPMRLEDFKEASERTVEKPSYLSTPNHLPNQKSKSHLETVLNWSCLTGRKPIEITFSAADLKTYEINAIKE